MAQKKSAVLSKKELNELVSNMQQNAVDKLNAGQKREQVVSLFKALSKCERATRLSIAKKVLDLI